MEAKRLPSADRRLLMTTLAIASVAFGLMLVVSTLANASLPSYDLVMTQPTNYMDQGVEWPCVVVKLETDGFRCRIEAYQGSNFTGAILAVSDGDGELAADVGEHVTVEGTVNNEFDHGDLVVDSAFLR